MVTPVIHRVRFNIMLARNSCGLFCPRNLKLSKANVENVVNDPRIPIFTRWILGFNVENVISERTVLPIMLTRRVPVGSPRISGDKPETKNRNDAPIAPPIPTSRRSMIAISTPHP